jgi:hypothetical protein
MPDDDDLKAIIKNGLLDLTLAVQSTNPDPKQTIQGYRDMRAAQQRAADHLVTATDALVGVTRRLSVATWALVVLTAVIVLVELARFFLRGAQ